MSKLAHSIDATTLRIDIDDALKAANTDLIASVIEDLQRENAEMRDALTLIAAMCRMAGPDMEPDEVVVMVHREARAAIAEAQRAA